MPVVITCPACRRKARVPDTALGKTVKCPGCAATFPATLDDSAPLPAQPTVEEEVGPEPSPEPPAPDARRVERTGVGLLALSQGLLAVSLALQLVVALIQLATTDSSSTTLSKGTFAASFTEILTVVGMLAAAGATALALIGAVFCVVPPANLTARAAAGAVLALSVMIAVSSDNSFGEMMRGMMMGASAGIGSRNRGMYAVSSKIARQVRAMSIPPLILGAALQTMFAVFSRALARRMRDRAAAKLAGGLAVAYPVVVIGIFLLVVLAGIFGSQSHPTFDQVMMVLARLFRTGLVAAGAFVLWRVWDRLRAG